MAMTRNPNIRPGNSRKPLPVSKPAMGRVWNGEADPKVHPINEGVYNAYDKRS